MMNTRFQTTTLGLELCGDSDIGQVLFCFVKGSPLEEVAECFRESANYVGADADVKNSTHTSHERSAAMSSTV